MVPRRRERVKKKDGDTNKQEMMTQTRIENCVDTDTQTKTIKEKEEKKEKEYTKEKENQVTNDLASKEGIDKNKVRFDECTLWKR